MHIIVVTACQLIVLCAIANAGVRPHYSPLRRASYSAPREDYSSYNNPKPEHRRHDARSIQFAWYSVENHNTPIERSVYDWRDPCGPGSPCHLPFLPLKTPNPRLAEEVIKFRPSVFGNEFFGTMYGPRLTPVDYAYNGYAVPAQTNEYQLPYGPVQELSIQLTINIFPGFRGVPEYRLSNVAEPSVLPGTTKNFADESRTLKRKEPVDSANRPVFLVKIYPETPATEETPAETETTTVADIASDPETTVGSAEFIPHDSWDSYPWEKDTNSEKGDEEETPTETETTTVADIASDPETIMGSAELDQIWDEYLTSHQRKETYFEKDDVKETQAVTETTPVEEIASGTETTMILVEHDESESDEGVPYWSSFSHGEKTESEKGDEEETPTETETTTVADIASDPETIVGPVEFDQIWDEYLTSLQGKEIYFEKDDEKETQAVTETTPVDVIVSDSETTVRSVEFDQILDSSLGGEEIYSKKDDEKETQVDTKKTPVDEISSDPEISMISQENASDKFRYLSQEIIWSMIFVFICLSFYIYLFIYFQY